jgi:Zn-dependent protease
MLGEPSRTPYDVRFSLLGVPVRIHPLFWLAQLLMAWNPEPSAVLMWILAALVSLLVHEFGHVVAMRAAKLRSHVVIFAFGGLTVADTRLPRSTAQQVMISLAGPLAGLALFLLVIVLGQVTGHPVRVRDAGGIPMFVPSFFPGATISPLDRFAFDLLLFNLYWSVFNLMPVFPLDGGQVARAVLVHRQPHDGFRQSCLLSAVTGAILAVVAWVHWGQFFLALLFAYLAWFNYSAWRPPTPGSEGRW